MAVYDLGQFTVLLVEDNGYVRRILEEMFRQFRIGRIPTSTNGQEAIDYLKTLGRGAASNAPDFIVSDLIMSPIDGLLLLRWVRMSKDSPNRFVPFVMLSGAADNEYVAQSRDLGVTEFLAKPFSVNSIYKKILEVIDYPRPFIATGNYFGPDRRRRSGAAPVDERRVTTDDDITVVQSAGRVAKPKDETHVWQFRLPNRLKEKAGGDRNVTGEVPMALLEQAEEQLERSALDFADWAIGYLGSLSKLCDEALEATGPRGKYFEEIKLLAHELRGQGGTFGYPLITEFAKMLYDVTGAGHGEADNDVEIAKAHIDAMRAVIREKISGDGGEIGRALQKTLKDAIAKHAAAG